MPFTRQRVAEAVYGASRIATIPVTDGKIDAGGTEREHSLSCLDHPHADRPRRIIAAAGDDGYGWHIPAFSNRRLQSARDFAAFKQRRHMIARQLAGIQHRLAPVPFRHVEPHRARGVRHVAGKIPRHAKTQVVFRQQNLRHLTKNLRLMALHPQEFWRGKTGHHQVARNLAGRRHAFLKDRALFRTAAIVPENSRAQNAMLAIQQRCAMHLPGNAQRLNAAQAVLLA